MKREKATQRNTTPTYPGYVEEVRGIDLGICPGCGAVVSFADVEHVEERTYHRDPDAVFASSGPVTVKGVWCRVPNCDQMLFDDEAWFDHLVNRKAWDREQGEVGQDRRARRAADEHDETDDLDEDDDEEEDEAA